MAKRIPQFAGPFQDPSFARVGLAREGEVIPPSRGTFPELHRAYDEGPDLYRYDCDMEQLAKIGRRIAELHRVAADIERARQDEAVEVGMRQAIPFRIAMRLRELELAANKIEEDARDAARQRQATRDEADRAARAAAAVEEKGYFARLKEKWDTLRDIEDEEELRPIKQATRAAAEWVEFEERVLRVRRLKRKQRAAEEALSGGSGGRPVGTPSKEMRTATASAERKRNDRRYAETRKYEILASVGNDVTKLTDEQIGEIDDLDQALYQANAQVDRDALEDDLMGKHGGKRR